MTTRKRKPPSGGLSTPQLVAYAKKRAGKPLSKAHRKNIGVGLMRSAAKRKGMTLSKYKKATGRV